MTPAILELARELPEDAANILKVAAWIPHCPTHALRSHSLFVRCFDWMLEHALIYADDQGLYRITDKGRLVVEALAKADKENEG